MIAVIKIKRLLLLDNPSMKEYFMVASYFQDDSNFRVWFVHFATRYVEWI